MDRPVLGLEVCKDVVREELYDVDERVRGRYPVLSRAAPRRDRGEQIDGGVLRFPVLGLVGVVLAQALADPRASDLRGGRFVAGRHKG